MSNLNEKVNLKLSNVLSDGRTRDDKKKSISVKESPPPRQQQKGFGATSIKRSTKHLGIGTSPTTKSDEKLTTIMNQRDKEKIPPFEADLIRINIPPPPVDILSKTAAQPPPYLSQLGKEELLNSLHSADSHLFEPLVGDVKLTLDDLKASILSYYTRLHSTEGATINEKLNYLQQYHYPSVFPISGTKASSSSLPATTPIIDDTPIKFDEKIKKKQQQQSQRPDIKDDIILSPEVSNQLGQNFFGTLHRVPGPPSQEFLEQEERGFVKTMSPKRQVQSSSSNGIDDLVKDLKSNVNQISCRLNGIGDVLRDELDDPSKRCFNYLTYPSIKRKPYFGNQKELEHHMLHLYADLYSKVQWNEKRIQTLRQQINVLQMHSIPSKYKSKTDPRIGL